MDRNNTTNANTDRQPRPGTSRQLKDNARTRIGEKSFHISAAKIWNKMPNEIKEAKTLIQAKRLIKETCKTMPV